MFKIDPHALYSKADLAESLDGLMTVETLLLRVGPHLRKPFKQAVWGRDLIDAINALDERGTRRGGRASGLGPRRSKQKRGGGDLIDLDQFS